MIIFFLLFNLVFLEEILVDDFNAYKNTNDFLKIWKSRTSNYKETLDNNSYYYFLNDTDSKNKFLCSALRQIPSDYLNKELKNPKITLDDSVIKSFSIYKNYWEQRIYIGKNYHKKNKLIQLSWRWLAKQLPEGADNDLKEKADNAIAVYVVLYNSWMNFKTLKYVWASSEKTGPVERFLNDDKKREIVVDNKLSPLNTWIDKKINISEDLKKFWPKLYNDFEIIGIAVMADSDNVKKPSYACVDDIKLEVK